MVMTFAHIMHLVSHEVINLPHRSKWELIAYHPSLFPCKVPNTLLCYVKSLPVSRFPEIVPVGEGKSAVIRDMRRGSAMVDCAIQCRTSDGSVQNRIDCNVQYLALCLFWEIQPDWYHPSNLGMGGREFPAWTVRVKRGVRVGGRLGGG